MFFVLLLCFLFCCVFWVAVVFSDLLCFLVCCCVFCFAVVFSDLLLCFLFCCCVFCFVVFSELLLCFLICCVFWFVVVFSVLLLFSDLLLCFLICCCVFCFVVVFSNLAFWFASCSLSSALFKGIILPPQNPRLQTVWIIRAPYCSFPNLQFYCESKETQICLMMQWKTFLMQNSMCQLHDFWFKPTYTNHYNVALSF